MLNLKSYMISKASLIPGFVFELRTIYLSLYNALTNTGRPGISNLLIKNSGASADGHLSLVTLTKGDDDLYISLLYQKAVEGWKPAGITAGQLVPDAIFLYIAYLFALIHQNHSKRILKFCKNERR